MSTYSKSEPSRVVMLDWWAGAGRVRSIPNSVVCVEVDQRIPSSKSNVIDVYREKSWPEN